MTFTTAPRVLSLIPPMTQLNTPYPSTAYLTGFLRTRGIQAAQAADPRCGRSKDGKPARGGRDGSENGGDDGHWPTSGFDRT